MRLRFPNPLPTGLYLPATNHGPLENPAYSQPGLAHWASVTHWPYRSQTCQLCPHPVALALLPPSAQNNVHPDVHIHDIFFTSFESLFKSDTLGGSPHPAQPCFMVLRHTQHYLAYCCLPLLKSTLSILRGLLCQDGVAGGETHVGMAWIK